VIMYTGNIIGKANVLSCDQVQELLKIRERLGVTTGGMPPCCAPAATNLRDSVALPGICPCGRKSPGCTNCGVKASGEPFGKEEDIIRLKNEVLKRLEPLLNQGVSS
jgi:L-fuculose-phosphate aldolase